MNTKILKKLFLPAFLLLAVAMTTMLTGIGGFTAEAAILYTPTDWSGVPSSLSNGDTLNLSGIINGDASHKTITISGGSATIIGNSNTVYINLSIVIEGGACVTVDNININDSQWENISPIVAGDANLGNTLYIKDSNVFTGGQYAAGINVSGSNSLIINEATSGSTVKANAGINGGACIGGGANSSCGNITINGGTIQAYSFGSGAGIGGGRDGAVGNITINGGTVTADGNCSGNGSGAGIGAGSGGGSGGTINISGGTVNATGGSYSAGIGGGSGTGCNITISGGIVNATGGGSAAAIGGGFGGSGGNITISGGTVTATGKNGAGIGGGLSHSSSNSASGGTINITGGIINAYGNNEGAGIGGGAYGNGGTITIGGSSTVTAYGGDQGGAGIGGGNYGSSGIITINNGTVKAYGGSQGAGIGGGNIYNGSGDNGGTITINGGIVTATGGTDGAGIGGGPDYGFNSGITTKINGGTVMATGGTNGAGIGGGNSNPDVYINISGGKVTANGGQYAAGIGGGYGNSNCYSEGGNITISGGTVTATGGNNEADIGKGHGSYSFICNFTGGSINATNKKVSPIASNGTTSVYETTLAVPSGSKINSLSVSTDSGMITYGYTDMQTDSNSKLYLFLPTGNATVNLTMDNNSTYGPYKGLVNNSGNSYLGFNQTGFGFDSSTKTNTTKTYSGGQFTVTAAGGQGTGAISYTVTSGSDVISVGSSTGLVTINKAGTAVITATKAADAIYNSASDTVTIVVSPANLTGFIISALPNQTYTGSTITPLVTVTNGTLTLVKNTDYNVSYSNNINTGTATVTVTGIGNYSGTINNTFTIVQANQTGFGFDSSTKTNTTKTYSHVQFNVTAAGGQSAGTISYAVTSGSNVISVDSSTGLVTIKNAGTAVITATKVADSNYNSASDTITITVNPADQTGFGFDSSTKTNTTKTYGDAQFSVTADGGQGTGSISYAVTSGLSVISVDSSTGLVTIKNAGTAVITATKVADSNYNSASDTITITVNPADLTSFTIAAISDQTYTGSAITPTVTVKDSAVTLVKDTDYTVFYSNNINAGTATVTVTGIGNYSGIISDTFAINAKTGFSVAAIPDQTYTGSAITPTVTVKDGAITLVKNNDYTVSYLNNKNTGTATVTVIGIHNYSGSISNTFKINAKTGFLVDAIPDQTYNGSAITPTVIVKDGALTLEKDNDYTVSYSSNTNAGTATVTVTGIGNYSGTINNTFTIVQANQTGFGFDSSTKTNTTKTYGDVQFSVTATGGQSAGTISYAVTSGSNVISVDSSTGLVTIKNAGIAVITATKAADSNYNSVSDTIAITVKPADQTGLGFDTSTKTNTTKTYGDSQFSVKADGGQGTGTISYAVTSGLSVISVDSSTGLVTIKNAGTAVITATKVADSNYNSASDTITITVNPADQTSFSFNSSTNTNSTKTYGDTQFNVTAAGGQGTGVISYAVTSGLSVINVDTSTGLVTINKAGTAVITATKAADSNYNSASCTVTIVVNSADLASFTIAAIPDQTYTGSAITPIVTVKDSAVTLVKDNDYTVSYSSNIDAGTATVTVTGIGNYSGTINNTFKINAKTGFSVADILDQTYTGSAITPTVTVKDGVVTLIKDNDYTVSYSNNINAGTAMVTVTGIGNYTGKIDKTFKIIAKIIPASAPPAVPTLIPTPNNSTPINGSVTTDSTTGTITTSAQITPTQMSFVTTPNVSVNLGNVHVTAPTTVLSSLLGSNSTSTIKMTQAASSNETQTAVNTISVMNGVTPITSFDINLNKMSENGTSNPIHQLGGTVTITIQLTSAQMAQITDQSKAVLLYYDPSTSTLTNMYATFDFTNKTVTFTTDHLSTYVIEMGDKTAPVVSGVSNNGIYNADETIKFDKGTAILDGAPFKSGGTVSKEGKHTLVVTDAAGNTTTVVFTIDKSSPVITVKTDKKMVIEDSCYSTTYVKVGISDKFSVTKSVTFNGKAYNWPLNSTFSKEGKYVITVKDQYGHTSKATFIIDKTAPKITIMSVFGGKKVTVIETNLSAKTVTLNGKAIAWPKGNKFTPKGAYVITVTDKAGHKATSKLSI